MAAGSIARDNERMAHYNSTTAADALGPATLILTLPKAAFELPIAQAILGRHKSPRRVARGASRRALVCVELDSIEWEWETETLSAFDEEGDSVSFESKTDYAIDRHAVDMLGRRQSNVSATLRVLGIPHDCEMFNPIDHETRTLRQRLDPEEPLGYCREASAGAPPPPGELLAMARKADNLESLRDWLADFGEEPADLGQEAAAFEASLEAPGRAKFLEASGQFLLWDGYRSSHLSFIPSSQSEWRPEALEWIRCLDEAGENPLARFARRGLPLRQPFVERAIEQALAQPEPDAAFVAAALDAWCASRAKNFGSYISPIDPGDAALAAKCFDRMPALPGGLTAMAKRFFDADLAPAGPRDSEADRALAEANWLRAQVAIARAEVPLAPSSRPKSL